jgi:hypothetical protein
MYSIKMITFCKSAKCPSSVELLAFQKREIPAEKSPAIEAHVNLCEFCEAEIEFYTHYPQSEDTCKKVEIPIPLLELAQSLLAKSNQDLLEILFDESKVSI